MNALPQDTFYYLKTLSIATPRPIQLWIDALRSGGYIQALETLQKDNAYCCLGVASRVAELQGITVHRLYDGISGASLFSQPEVRKWLNIAPYGDFPEWVLTDEHFLKILEEARKTNRANIPSSRLVSLNDQLRLTFDQIADFIEHYWLALVDLSTYNITLENK